MKGTDCTGMKTWGAEVLFWQDFTWNFFCWVVFGTGVVLMTTPKSEFVCSLFFLLSYTSFTLVDFPTNKWLRCLRSSGYCKIEAPFFYVGSSASVCLEVHVAVLRLYSWPRALSYIFLSICWTISISLNFLSCCIQAMSVFYCKKLSYLVSSASKCTCVLVSFTLHCCSKWLLPCPFWVPTLDFLGVFICVYMFFFTLGITFQRCSACDWLRLMGAMHNL